MCYLLITISTCATTERIIDQTPLIFDLPTFRAVTFHTHQKVGSTKQTRQTWQTNKKYKEHDGQLRQKQMQQKSKQKQQKNLYIHTQIQHEQPSWSRSRPRF